MELPGGRGSPGTGIMAAWLRGVRWAAGARVCPVSIRGDTCKMLLCPPAYRALGGRALTAGVRQPAEMPDGGRWGDCPRGEGGAARLSGRSSGLSSSHLQDERRGTAPLLQAPQHLPSLPRSAGFLPVAVTNSAPCHCTQQHPFQTQPKLARSPAAINPSLLCPPSPAAAITDPRVPASHTES
jgi:hypothetical protein